MDLRLVKISKDEWKALASHAHLAVFSEKMPPEFDRIDFALLALKGSGDKDVPVAYMTLRELDAESVYMKHGGAFEPIKGTTVSMPCYVMMLNFLKEHYRRVTTLVENTNTVYLKMALSVGFKVIGLRYFGKSILLELFMGEE